MKVLFKLLKFDVHPSLLQLAVKPLLTEEEFKAYKAKIDAFGKQEGPQIQQHLSVLEKEAPYNWMEGFWQSM